MNKMYQKVKSWLVLGALVQLCGGVESSWAFAKARETSELSNTKQAISSPKPAAESIPRPTKIEEVFKVGFIPLQESGMIVGQLGTQIVFKSTLKGGNAEVVKVEGLQGDKIIWSSDRSSQKVVTVLDGAGDYSNGSLKGHYVVFNVMDKPDEDLRLSSVFKAQVQFNLGYQQPPLPCFNPKLPCAATASSLLNVGTVSLELKDRGRINWFGNPLSSNSGLPSGVSASVGLNLSASGSEFINGEEVAKSVTFNSVSADGTVKKISLGHCVPLNRSMPVDPKGIPFEPVMNCSVSTTLNGLGVSLPAGLYRVSVEFENIKSRVTRHKVMEFIIAP